MLLSYRLLIITQLLKIKTYHIVDWKAHCIYKLNFLCHYTALSLYRQQVYYKFSFPDFVTPLKKRRLARESLALENSCPTTPSTPLLTTTAHEVFHSPPSLSDIDTLVPDTDQQTQESDKTHNDANHLCNGFSDIIPPAVSVYEVYRPINDEIIFLICWLSTYFLILYLHSLFVYIEHSYIFYFTTNCGFLLL